MHSPKTAIVELIANAWDAGAKRVDISWPIEDGGRFEVEDNGHGMTPEQFDYRWRCLKYDRLAEQGSDVTIECCGITQTRRVFGRNGVGRYAGFCFGDSYFVETWRDGTAVSYRIDQNINPPVVIKELQRKAKTGSGTRIYIDDSFNIRFSAEEVRAEIGTRFLSDPSFEVFVNSVKVNFSDIPNTQVEREEVEIPEIGVAELITIQTTETDRSTLQHGIAWHVNGRRVGDCNWNGHDKAWIVDGRKKAAKKFTFIIKADFLHGHGAVLKDWNGFDTQCSAFETVASVVYGKINQRLIETTASERAETLTRVKQENSDKLRQMSLRSTEIWLRFVEKSQVECPSIKEQDLIHLAGVLASLEASKSKFAIIERLGKLEPEKLEDLHLLLGEWTVDTAKTVLDELRNRMLLVNELQKKTSDTATDEVQELQPLFEQGLWIFGPEFETIEFTSNQTMTTVIRSLLGRSKIKGSKNRPDFVVIPDGSVGIYSYPEYCPETGSEMGVKKLVIIELKKPGVRIGSAEKEQCWKYVKELHSKGLLSPHTEVMCFPIGMQVDPLERSPRTEMDELVRIVPLTYSIVIERAKSRLLRLHDRVKNAPFLQGTEITAFLQGAGPTQRSLF